VCTSEAEYARAKDDMLGYLTHLDDAPSLFQVAACGMIFVLLDCVALNMLPEYCGVNVLCCLLFAISLIRLSRSGHQHCLYSCVL
jgi:hypothetical protein